MEWPKYGRESINDLLEMKLFMTNNGKYRQSCGSSIEYKQEQKALKTLSLK